jgi:tetratricopeptide (TPR) repeat protein
MSNYAVAKLDDIEVIDDGRAPMRPVRFHLGIESFGVNAWTAKEAGDRLINEHDEAEPGGHEELYVVLNGHARFEIDGETVDAPQGTFVFVKQAAKRTAFAEEAGTTLLALGGEPGQAYQASGWELWSPLNQLYRAGEFAEAAERGRAIAEANPQYPAVLYNTACCEALSGQKDEAIEHLRRALASGNEQLRKLVKEDTDFDSLRDEPAFKELVG